MPAMPGREAMTAPPAASFEQLEHELRTPLASMRSLSEILRDYPDLTDAQRRRFLESMLAENERLSRTIERLLDWLERNPSLS
jgi:signal transduction histidine kinase